MKSFMVLSYFCAWSVFALDPKENVVNTKHCDRHGVSLYEKLWKNNMDIARDTMKTDFLKRMEAGTLEAERYINFTLQDIYYLEEVTKLLQKLSKEDELREDLKSFIMGRYNSYSSFEKYSLQMYQLKNTSAIIPSPTIANYIQSYKAISEDDHVYFAIALLPCSKLWPYVAQNLKISKKSPYYPFKKNNVEDNSKKHYENLLEKYRCNIDESKAQSLFRLQMAHEREFFSTS
ncbi:aminopyrimidine aminohydrolase-like [Lepisosteus oculatus]|uniref:aminopyrimidine aminohydrolase-like n=1 Tax=Lepisosteus oculatus TaxID=7918 RepID=UPI00074029CD|nr:PREDICTED: uncharacterized protein LOC107079203 [Lepisosteus oculatus]